MMKINKELCNNCGSCVSECWKSAIVSDGEGCYQIDKERCDNCEAFYEIECIRVCATKAITKEDGTVPAFNPTFRLMAGHLQWLIAIMGSRDTKRFPVGNQEYDKFRKLIAQAYLNPDLKVQVAVNFDDICIACPRRQEQRHAESLVPINQACLKQLGLQPGTTMNFWKLIELVEDKYSLSFIKSQWSEKYQDLVAPFCKFIACDAKFYTNDD